MSDDAFVDTHVHFWDHSVEGLSWAWLEADFEHPRVRGLHEYDAPRYAAPEFRTEVAECGVTKIVHVQAARLIPDPERETAWLQAMGDAEGWPSAVIGNCRLIADDGPEVVARHVLHPRFRGVRDMSANGALVEPAVRRTCAALGTHDAVCELMVSHPEFSAMATLAADVLDTTFVLGHSGLPIERTPEYFRAWAGALPAVAAADNVVCKISALANGADPNWTVESIRPWVMGCIEAFGPERCFFGSNWPIDRHFGTYARLIDAYRTIVSELSPGEQRAVLSGTAERIYRI